MPLHLLAFLHHPFRCRSSRLDLLEQVSKKICSSSSLPFPPRSILEILFDQIHSSCAHPVAHEHIRKKHLVTFRMVPKRATGKGKGLKGKEDKIVESTLAIRDGWRVSKCSESNILFFSRKRLCSGGPLRVTTDPMKRPTKLSLSSYSLNVDLEFLRFFSAVLFFIGGFKHIT